MIIAHRGFAKNCQENTLEAYRRAIEVGVDGIELDVRKTKDNILILFHDELINDQQINQLTYTEINYLANNLGWQVPTLVELLKLVQGKVKLDVELKEKGYETEVIALILEYLTIEQFIATSFQLESLLALKSNYPSVKTGILLNKKTATNFELKDNLITIDFLAPNIQLLDSNWLKLARIHNKSIFVWTVNEEKVIEKLLQESMIVGIITDKSDLAVGLKNKLKHIH